MHAGCHALHALLNVRQDRLMGEVCMRQVTDVTEQQWDQALNTNVKG